MKKLQFHTLEFKQFLKKYDLVFSPRTTIVKEREADVFLTNQIIKHFDPFTVSFLKKEFECNNGKINKLQVLPLQQLQEYLQFIGCLKNHLLQYQPQASNRQQRLIKYLSIIFDEIDLLEQRQINWEDFQNYLISKASSTGGLGEGIKGGKKSLNSIATGGSTDEQGNSFGQVDKIKPYSLAVQTNIPTRDKDKHKRDGGKSKEGYDMDSNKGGFKKGGAFQKDEGKAASLHKAIYLLDMDKVAVVEERSDTIQFINPKQGERAFKDLDCGQDAGKISGYNKSGSSNYNQFKKKVIVMSMSKDYSIYIHSNIVYLRFEDYNNLLLVSTDDSIIRAWHYNGNQFVPVNPLINDEPLEVDIKILKAKQPQYCMAWDDIHQMLYSGQRDGMINVWSLRQTKPVGFLGTNTEIQTSSSSQNAFLKPQDKFKEDDIMFAGYQSNVTTSGIGHKDIVTELLMLPKLQYLASCSLDKKVILWDTITGEQKRVYMEHTMGVVSLTFNSEHILLFSAGFDHDICVWNPYIDNPVYKVSAHNAPVVCVHAIDHTPQLLSSDSDGFIKVWDIRSFECVQTINVQENFESHKFNLSYMISLWTHKRLMIAGRQLLFFEYDKNQNPSLADDQAPLCCIYIEKSQEFITPVMDSVKCWNALNGTMKHVFKNLMTGGMQEITAFCMDSNKKRFIIGDSKGQVKVFNCGNGELMKVLTNHQHSPTKHQSTAQSENNSEIINVFVVTTKEMSMIVSVGSNGVIQVHEDDKLTETAVRRTINIPPNYQIQVARVYQQGIGANSLKFIFVGLNKGYIKTYELETGRPDASYPAHSENADIIEICTLTKKPFFFTADNFGNVYMWVAPPCSNKYQKCYEFQNAGNDKKELCSITCLTYNEDDDILYSGDERGSIVAYDFKDITNQIFIKQDDSSGGVEYDSNAIASGATQSQQVLKKVPSIAKESPLIIWKNKEHMESIREIKYEEQLIQLVLLSNRIFGMKLIVSTSFDRKIKLWNALTGEFIDSLRKGNTDEAQPINYKERFPEQKIVFNAVGGRKKAAGIDFDSLKRKVEVNPVIEKIKEQINENQSSTEWNLTLDIDQIQKQDQAKFDSILNQVTSLESHDNADIAFQQNQLDMEIQAKVHTLYQNRTSNEEQNRAPIKKLSSSLSQPYLNTGMKSSMGGSSGFGMTQGTAKFQKSTFAPQAPQSNFMASSSALLNSLKNDVVLADGGYIPKKQRLQENKESLPIQKLLYPSKFRKDPYRRKINQSNNTGSTLKLPSIMNGKQGSSGQMLMGMIGIKDRKLARNVSEAALKLVSALDRIEEL